MKRIYIILSVYNNNPDLFAVGIDTRNGSKSEVQNFRNQTGISIPLLQIGGSAASTYSTSYDNLTVIGSDGKIKYKSTGRTAAAITPAKNVIITALQEISTAADKTKLDHLGQNYLNPFSTFKQFLFILKLPAK